MRNELCEAQNSRYNAKEFPLGLHLVYIWIALHKNKQPAQNNLPTSHQRCVLLKHHYFFLGFSFFLTASHFPRQDRVAVLKSMRHLPFPSHLACLRIGTAPQLRFYPYGSPLLNHDGKYHFVSSWLDKGEGAKKSLNVHPDGRVMNSAGDLRG